MPQSLEKTNPALPIWYQAEAPLGSAVRYVASLSPKFNWVGIYILKGKWLEIGPFIGEPSPHTKIPVGKGVCGSAVALGQDQNVADVHLHSNYLACSIKTKSELVVLIHDKKGKIVGQIDIDSHTPNAFGAEEEAQVKKVAKELGNLWPGQKKYNRR